MVRIISDTSTLYSSAQAKEAGFSVAPLSVTIGGNSYREFDEISSDAFVDLIQQGNMPTSSQPAVGEVCALYEQYPDDEILNISMADGLSGTYASAVAASDLCENKNITVLNSRTLCGPHRYLVERAVELAAQNRTLSEIVEHMHQLMDTGKKLSDPRRLRLFTSRWSSFPFGFLCWPGCQAVPGFDSNRGWPPTNHCHSTSQLLPSHPTRWQGIANPWCRR
jgi:DegV family protein with EDD domain